MSELATLALFSNDSLEATEKLLSLASEWNARKVELENANAHMEAVYDALDLDLLNVLAQILPYLLGLFTGGFTVETILGILRMVIPLIVKDSQLQAILTQIIETILRLLVK